MAGKCIILPLKLRYVCPHWKKIVTVPSLSNWDISLLHILLPLPRTIEVYHIFIFSSNQLVYPFWTTTYHPIVLFSREILEILIYPKFSKSNWDYLPKVTPFYVSRWRITKTKMHELLNHHSKVRIMCLTSTLCLLWFGFSYMVECVFH